MKAKKQVLAVLFIALCAPALFACGAPPAALPQNGQGGPEGGGSAPGPLVSGAVEDAGEGPRGGSLPPASREVTDEGGMMDVSITAGGQTFAARFYDNPSARAIVAEMPFSLEMDDFAAQEKVAELLFRLPPATAQTPATIHSGDICLWSGNSLVLFYTEFSNRYGYVVVGYVADAAGLADALGSGSVQVAFAAGG